MFVNRIGGLNLFKKTLNTQGDKNEYFSKNYQQDKKPQDKNTNKIDGNKR